MKCTHCKNPIDEETTYWEDEDGCVFCSDYCLDENEKTRTPNRPPSEAQPETTPGGTT